VCFNKLVIQIVFLFIIRLIPMAIYYKFKSARDYDTISMDGPFITVGLLKEKIYETKHLGSGKDLDIVISNAQTNEGLSSSFLSYSPRRYCAMCFVVI